MTSQARIAANRSNARRSRGPRTAAGKSKASRNALRHGLSAVTRIDPALGPRIDAIATKLCGGDENPLLHEQALIIAENHVVLTRVRALRLAAIERRLRDGDGRGDTRQRETKCLGQPPPVEPRVEFDAIMKAMPEIDRLERFERRAWRNRSRAILDFLSVKARS